MTWKIAETSLQGTSHLSSQTPCQDAHFTNVMHGKLRGDLIIAVSDGMGSAKHSHIASTLAVTTAVEHIYRNAGRHRYRWIYENTLLRKFNPVQYHVLLNEAVRLARKRILQEAQKRQHNPRDYACTLIIAVATANEWHVVHIGDGAAVGFRNADTVFTLSRPENGEYANSTTPITASNWQSHVRYSQGHEPLDAIAVFSDGIQNLCINHQTGDAYEGFFVPILRWFRGLPRNAKLDKACEQFLNSPKIRNKCDDDLTLVMAWRA